MLRISSHVTHGIWPMIVISFNGAESHVQCNTSIDTILLTKRFIGQIMLMLRSGGRIASLRGRSSGRRLACPASQITLLGIGEALVGSDDACANGSIGHRPSSLPRRSNALVRCLTKPHGRCAPSVAAHSMHRRLKKPLSTRGVPREPNSLRATASHELRSCTAQTDVGLWASRSLA